MFNAYSMMENLRESLSESSAKHWSDRALLAALNKSLASVYRLVAAAPGDWYLERMGPITPISGKVLFTGIAAYGIRPAFLEVVSDGSHIPIVINARDKRVTYQRANGLSYTNDLYAFIYKDAIQVNQEGFSSAVYLWFERATAMMHAGTAAAGGVQSLTLQASQDASIDNDYYNGETIEIVSGTGSGTRTTVSDYIGSTRVATLAAGTFGAGSVYGTVPNIPEPGLDLLINQALLFAYFKPGAILAKEYVYLIRDEVNRARVEFEAWLSARVKETRRVRWTGAYHG